MADQPSFMNEMPTWAKLFMQLGFAGLVAVLYFNDSRDRSTQLRDLQTETRIQAREDRSLFQIEMKEQRLVVNENTKTLAMAADKIQIAIDKLSNQNLILKKEMTDLKFPMPQPRSIPEER